MVDQHHPGILPHAEHVRNNATPSSPTEEQLWSWLAEVPDPEIPVISVVDLGIVRGVRWNDAAQTADIQMTPTYSGCPANEVIQEQIREHLQQCGVPHVTVSVQLSPAWTTDWMTESGRQKLRAFGIAPPQGKPEAAVSDSAFVLLPSDALRVPLPCPLCGSTRTELVSQFGSTPCKAMYRCLECLEPFDHFKCH